MEEIRKAADKDEEFIMLQKYLRNDEPFPSQLQMYKSVIEEISEDNGLLLLHQRLLIPKAMRKNILQRLHASHQGVERTLRRARQTVFWPGLTSDVKTTVKACEACIKYSPSQAKEPMQRDTMPTRIFEEIAVDLFELNDQHYMAVVDRYSG